MNLLSVNNVSKLMNEGPLFEEVSLGIDEGEKIGFIGRNGCGKSTFLRLLKGETEPDSGTISRNKDLVIGSLEQRVNLKPETSLRDYLFESGDPAVLLAKEYHETLINLHERKEYQDKITELEARMERENGFAVEHAYRSFCTELGLPAEDTPMENLSGGMMRKASIARCLAMGANLLILDEPTNHVDLDTVLWLEEKLKKTRQAFILVTHDRAFLDAVCTRIMEIDSRRIYSYPGNYSAYLEQKAEREQAKDRAETRRQSILRVELEWLKRGPKARTGKDKGRKARIEDLIDAGMREEASMQGFSSSQKRLGKNILELDRMTKSYGEKSVLSPFSHTFKRGERIGVIGPNGSGKTTFLDLIAGRTEPDSGSVTRGETAAFAYFDQTGRYTDGNISVLDYIKETGDRIPINGEQTVTAEQFLERFLFPRSMFALPLEKLSGGEWRRLHLIRLLSTAPNFLLFDEPTNDLDIDTIRLLEDYLIGFRGCILLVSHDRSLLERVTDYLFIFDGKGGIRSFVGSYADYRAETEREEASVRESRREDEKPRPSRAERRSGLSFKERQELERLLPEISKLEEEQKELEAGFQAPLPDPDRIERDNRRYAAVCALIEEKMVRWEELAGRE